MNTERELTIDELSGRELTEDELSLVSGGTFREFISKCIAVMICRESTANAPPSPFVNCYPSPEGGWLMPG